MNHTEDNNKVIYTDSYRVKDILWEAYTGFIENYHDYLMLYSMKRYDPINIASMNKYANYFYDEIEDYLEDFPNIENLDKVKKIFEINQFEFEDYKIIRKFFAKFMKLSGIKNIVKEKDLPSESVLNNR